MSDASAPQSILIIGAGVFGLSTALSLLSKPQYASTEITILDGADSLPNPSGSSVDANRIIRADYAHKHYSQLALEAQEHWRDKSRGAWGGEDRYHEPGLVLSADGAKDEYVKEALANVRSLATDGGIGKADLKKIQELLGQEELIRATGYEGVSGDHGYANFNSGWADAGASVAYVLRRIQSEGGGRVAIRSGVHVSKLLLSADECQGVELVGGEQVKAQLTVVAAGAWSPSLVNLQGRCLATGQAMAYIDITEDEQKAMEHRPTIFNMSRGMFIIPPRGKELKIARHGYGYRNPVQIPKDVFGEGDGFVNVSVPKVGVSIPFEAEDALREALRELVPQMGDRPFTRTRICWYCDTPTGDFLITYHPRYKNSLFLATGGSGHGFKFFPVIGDKIVDAIQGNLDPELAELWSWRSDEDLQRARAGQEEFLACEDGSRAGRRCMILDDESARTR